MPQNLPAFHGHPSQRTDQQTRLTLEIPEGGLHVSLGMRGCGVSGSTQAVSANSGVDGARSRLHSAGTTTGRYRCALALVAPTPQHADGARMRVGAFDGVTVPWPERLAGELRSQVRPRSGIFARTSSMMSSEAASRSQPAGRWVMKGSRSRRKSLSASLARRFATEAFAVRDAG